eukprot:2537070-Rhodomonas_salina.2
MALAVDQAPAQALELSSSVSRTGKATGCNRTRASLTGFCGTVVPNSVGFHPAPATTATRMRNAATRQGASRAPETQDTRGPACRARRMPTSGCSKPRGRWRACQRKRSTLLPRPCSEPKWPR